MAEDLNKNSSFDEFLGNYETSMHSNENFKSYLLTPYESDNDENFKNALYFESAPGRSVCMSPAHFRNAKDGYDKGKIYQSSPCIEQGWPTSSIIVGILGALAIGFSAGVLLR